METESDDFRVDIIVVNAALFPSPPTRFRLEGIDTNATIGDLFEEIALNTGFEKNLFVIRAIALHNVFTTLDSDRKLRHVGFFSGKNKKCVLHVERAYKYHDPREKDPITTTWRPLFNPTPKKRKAAEIRQMHMKKHKVFQNKICDFCGQLLPGTNVERAKHTLLCAEQELPIEERLHTLNQEPLKKHDRVQVVVGKLYGETGQLLSFDGNDCVVKMDSTYDITIIQKKHLARTSPTVF